jgi:hypothetical protein
MQALFAANDLLRPVKKKLRANMRTGMIATCVEGTARRRVRCISRAGPIWVDAIDPTKNSTVPT